MGLCRRRIGGGGEENEEGAAVVGVLVGVKVSVTVFLGGEPSSSFPLPTLGPKEGTASLV